MDKRSLLFVLLLAVSLFFVNMWFTSKEEPRPLQTQQTQEPVVSQASPAPAVQAPQRAMNKATEEQFYVLENEYQQLVFSNVGGALAEINLPLKSAQNPKGVIRPIRFDKTMQKDFSQNDHFPSFSYETINGEGQSVKNDKGNTGGYYPLIRRTLFGSRGQVFKKIPSQYYALNTLSQDQSTAELLYQVTRFEKNLIEFEATESNRRIIKTYSFTDKPDDAPYCFNLTVKVDGDARGLWLSSGVPEVELISDSFSPSLKYRITSGQKTSVEQIDLPKLTTSMTSIQPNWIANSNGFLGIIIDPKDATSSGFNASYVSGEQTPTRISLIDAHYRLYPPEKYPGYELQIPLQSTRQTSSFRIFAGPFASDVLKKVDAYYSNPDTGYNPDYIGSQSFHGWFSFISEPFAKFLFFLMQFFYQMTHSWGIAIILLTAALRIMLYPLNAWSIKSTLRMQEVSPQVTVIQERYKKDPKRAQMEVMKLYKEKGVNPLSGCFPLLIQMPFLIGMFDLLKSTFELRGASFIPGWIDNLTAPDVLFSWNYPIIFFGTEFHLLPFLLGIAMYFQQKVSSSAPKDKSQMTDQQKQQKLMGNIMVVVFTVMFYHFPSGLNIYWLSSMLMGILQQWIMTRKRQKKDAGMGTIC
jgi:YidC/Oxa1 family membrane protein insertase